MPLLYPDVIKLDLRLLAERDPLDVARIVTAVGAEAERRHATVLAEGIDSEAQLEMARAAGATLGQGFMLGEPAPLPDPLPDARAPAAARRLGRRPVGPAALPARDELEAPDARAAGAGRARGGADVRPGLGARADRDAAGRARTRSHSSLRYEALRDSLGFVGVLEPGRPRGHVDRGRARAGLRRVLRRAAREGDEWCFATSYDRELVVECALLLMARLPQSPPPRR